jgi:maleylpyruvate isomerase
MERKRYASLHLFPVLGGLARADRVDPQGVPWTPEFVHLLRDGGEQLRPAYRAKNPTALIPILETDDGTLLLQSLAIIEWLEETYPTPPLLPAEPFARAKVRGFALTIACEIHPLNNLRVLRYLKREMDQPDSARDRWYAHWIGEGLTALADICLVPQLANARRFNCPLDAYPSLLRAESAALARPEFRDTAPEKQSDAS